jgi:hypothetical protein
MHADEHRRRFAAIASQPVIPIVPSPPPTGWMNRLDALDEVWHYKNFRNVALLAEAFPPFAPANFNTNRHAPPPAFESSTMAAVEGANGSELTPVSIVPTNYPQVLPDTIVAPRDHFTLDHHGKGFVELQATIQDLVVELRRSNEISGEVGEKLAAELKAGLAILASPKADPKMIHLLLGAPLKFIGKAAGGAVVGYLAVKALQQLMTLTGIAF